MADPLAALRHAQSIGPAYTGPELRGELPLGPGFLGAIGEAASPAIRALRGILGRSTGVPNPTLVEAAPAASQAMPGMGAVDDMIGALKYNLAKIPSAGSAARAVAQPLGQQVAEFAPVGGETAYNATRPAARPVTDLAERAYQNILGRGGRMASESGRVSPEDIAIGGAGAGLAAYGAPKAYRALRDLGSSLNQQYNPFQRYSDELTPKP